MQNEQKTATEKLCKYTGGRKVVGEVCASVGGGWGWCEGGGVGDLIITHTLTKSNVKHAHMRTCMPIKSVQQTVDRSTQSPVSFSV